jgi:hypothetical protein
LFVFLLSNVENNIVVHHARKTFFFKYVQQYHLMSYQNFVLLIDIHVNDADFLMVIMVNEI